MLRPSIFGEDLFDEMMNFPFDNDFFGRRGGMFGKNADSIMKTDIRETDNSYELDIDLPGYNKEDINAQLKNGYLTISASRNVNNDEKDDKTGKYIRRERYVGSMSRSFYVGEGVTQEDIHAKFESGILKLTVPKKDAKAIEQSNYIAIEG